MIRFRDSRDRVTQQTSEFTKLCHNCHCTVFSQNTRHMGSLNPGKYINPQGCDFTLHSCVGDQYTDKVTPELKM